MCRTYSAPNSANSSKSVCLKAKTNPAEFNASERISIKFTQMLDGSPNIIHCEYSRKVLANFKVSPQ